MKNQITQILAKPELRILRKQKGYSMAYLAELAGCTKITVFNAEHRVNGVRSYNAEGMAKALGRELDELFEITQHDDRHPRNGGTRKLTESDVRIIRAVHDTTLVSVTALANEYGITRKAVYNIINRKCWKDVK